MIVYASNAQHRGWLMCDRVEPHEDRVYYVVEIDEDRYSGCYSLHGCTAWPGVRPNDIDDGDIECMNFWDQWRDKLLYGGGATPQQAFQDLIQKATTLGIPLVDHDDESWSNLKVVLLHAVCRPVKAMLYGSQDFKAWLGDVSLRPVTLPPPTAE